MWIYSLLMLFLTVNSAWAVVTPTDPIAPTAVQNTVDTTYNVKPTVTTHSGLQTALNSATCATNDLIPVAIAGWTAASSAQITLPVDPASCTGSAVGVGAISGSSGAHAISGSSGLSATNATGDKYITIASVNYGSLNPGVITDAQVGNMATITTPGNVVGYFVAPQGTHHIRLLGIKLKAPTGGTGCLAVMAECEFFLQQDDGTGTGGHHIIFDRVIFDGDSTTGTLRGMQVVGHDISFIRSRMRNIFDPTHNSEGQGFLMGGGPGPYLINQSEIQANSEAVFAGDSGVESWTGGSPGVGSPVIPHNITITENWIHQSGIPAGAMSNSKNLWELKQGYQVKISGNKFQYHPEGAQFACVNLVSYRGSQAVATDIEFSNNWVIDCAQALNITFRPTFNEAITGVAGDGTTNCSGGACIKVTVIGDCICTTGDAVTIASVTGTVGTAVNGSWLPITRIDSTHFTINVAMSGSYTSGGTVNFYHQSTPLKRVKIYNNYFMDISSAAAGSVTRANRVSFLLNPVAQPTYVGGTDASLSATGDWYPDDFNLSHNTLSNPTAGDTLEGLFKLNGDPNVAAVWPGRRWAIRDNAFKLSLGTASQQSTISNGAPGVQVGSAALNFMSDSATRDFSHNIGWNATSFGPTDDSLYAAPDDWITNSTSGCSTVIVLVDCTATTVAGAALQASSPGHNASSDAVPVDVGANMTTLAAALANVPN